MLEAGSIKKCCDQKNKKDQVRRAGEEIDKKKRRVTWSMYIFATLTILAFLLVLPWVVQLITSFNIVCVSCINWIASKLLPPLSIVTSALIGARVALETISSNRREYVRKNTLKTLNDLEMDTDYWQDASDLMNRIKSLNNKIGTSESESSAALRVMNKDDLHGLKYHKVLRRLEWLMESAYLGHIDTIELACRKGVMISYIYDACSKVIEDKRKSHAEVYGEDTSCLVYMHLCNDQYREKLLAIAKRKNDSKLDLKYLEK